MARSETESSVGYLIKRVQLALRRACDAALKSTGLSMAQHAMLRSLADHPDASAAELARLCFVTRQSLQDVLNSLRSAGLVEAADAPPQGRAQSLHPYRARAPAPQHRRRRQRGISPDPRHASRCT
jgi:hypothetical protein